MYATLIYIHFLHFLHFLYFFYFHMVCFNYCIIGLQVNLTQITLMTVYDSNYTYDSTTQITLMTVYDWKITLYFKIKLLFN